MPEQIEVFRVAATYDVEVEKNSLNSASKLLDNFYNKYNNKSLKVDTADMSKAMKQGVSEMQSIYKKGVDQLSAYQSSTSTQPPWWKAEDGLEQQFVQAREEMYRFFEEAKVLFSDGSVVFGLENILEKSMDNVSIVAVDLGNRVQHLKNQITDVLEELDISRFNKYYDESVDYSSGNMSKSEILDRIDALKKLIEYQKEIELFNGKKFSISDSPTMQDTSTLNGNLETLRDYFDQLEKFNLRTTEQLKRRNELISEANETWQWDDDYHKNAKENIRDDYIYEDAIQSLEGYIEQRKAIINALKDNEDELFSVDGITEYVDNATKQIERFQRQKLELQNLREGKSDVQDGVAFGNLTELLEELKRIETAINSIKEAFEPLTTALSSEDSAIGAMVKANIADLDLLNSKVEEAFSNIEKLSNKQFNVTNVLSGGTNSQNDIEQIRQFRQEAKEAYKQVEELYTESFETAKKIKGTPEGLTAFLDFSNTMSDFDMTDLAKRIKSRSAASLGIVIDELNEWKKVLLQFNSLRNNVEAGSFNVSKYSDTSSKVKVGSKTTDKDDQTLVEKNTIDNTDILNKVRDLGEQIKEEFDSIRSKIKEVFDFSTINPNFENIKSITEVIYQQFVDLQSKINALEFKLQLPDIINKPKDDSSVIDNASEAMKNEGQAAQDAVPKKDAFTEANKKAAESGKATEEAMRGAADGIQAEVKAVEQASSAFDKVSTTFDNDNKPLYKTETKSKVGQDSVDTTTKNYVYKDDEDDKGWKLSTETLVQDFKKRAAELKKESDKIALAQKTVNKFISQFESKTAGQASKIKGFDGENGLKGFTIQSLNDIEIATQKMIELDAEYNKLTKSFRQGTKSMNPFVNAITGIGEMENKIQEVEIAFNKLNTKPEKLSEEVDGLIPLFANMMSFISEDADGNKIITDIYGMAEAYGVLNAALRQVNSNIKIQKQIDASKSKDINFGLDLEKQFSSMSKQQAQWGKNGQLTDELRQKINEMFDSLAGVTNSSELKSWKTQWSILKDEVMETKYQIEAARKAQEPINKKEAQDKAYWDDRFKDSVIGLIKPEKRPELEQIKASMLQQAAATEESVVEQYDAIMTIITNKNNALQKLMSAKGPEEQKYWQDTYSAWFGAWNALDKDVLSKFFEDAGNQAMLGADKIDKFNKAVEQSKILTARNRDKQKKTLDDAKDKADKEAGKKQKDLGTDISNAYKEYTDAVIRLKKLQNDTSDKDHTNEIQATIQDIQDAKKKLSELGIDVNKISENTVLTEKQTNELLEQRLAYKKQLLHIDSQAADAEVNKANKEAQKYGKTVYNRESKYHEIIDSNMRSIGEINLSDDLLQKIERYKTAYKEFEDLRNKIDNSTNVSDGLKNQFQDAALEVEKLRKEIMGVFKESQKFSQIPKSSILGTKTLDSSQIQNAKLALIEYAAELTNGQLKITGFNASNTEMYGVLDKGSGVVEQVTVALQSGTNMLYAYESGTKQVSNSWQQLGDKLKSGVKNIIGQYVGFHETIQAFKQGITYVKEIDLALTELKKVTNETEATYNKFLNTASNVSGEIGSTVSDFTNATAAFARLGHTIDESTDMAKTTIVYKNVADGLDSVEAATDSIISTMMAFGISANDTMGIVDRFNAVGNSFAITSAGIGDALQRSASALYSAGNSIDESIALVTAANSVIQNPEQVGTALKTLALRLRGAKVELEDAGLETDNMAESTSQLQAKLLALTHGKVDIMLDADTFKNTTQILREMSDAWVHMTDIERASALELMGGKRQANILSSVIQNFETVEDVITTSMNSSGSALAENEKWLDSIEGKTYQFTNALETMWSNLIDSKTVKSFLGFLTGVIKILDTVPGKIAAIIAATAGVAKFNGFSLIGLGQDALKSLQNLSNVQASLATAKNTMPISATMNSSSIQAYAAAVSSLTANQQAAALASAGLNKEQIQLALTLNGANDAVVREATAHLSVSNAKKQEAVSDKELIKSKILYKATALEAVGSEDALAAAQFLRANATAIANGETLESIAGFTALTPKQQAAVVSTYQYAAANTTLTSTFKGLGAAIKLAFVSNPIGFVISAVTTLISVVSVGSLIFGDFFKTAESSAESATNAINKYTQAQKSLKDEKKTVDELAASYAKLSSGVNTETNSNIGLTTESYEEYLGVCNQIADMFPELISGYDAEGNAILTLKGHVDELTKAYEEKTKAASGQFLTSQNKKDIWDTYSNTINLDVKKKWWGDILPTGSRTEQQEMLNFFNHLNAQGFERLLNVSDSINSIWDSSNDDAFYNILSELGYSGEYLTNGKFENFLNDTGLNFEDIAKQIKDGDISVTDGINTLKSNIGIALSNVNTEISSSLNNIKQTVSAQLLWNLDYQALDQETKGIVDTIVNNLNPDIISQMGATSIDDLVAKLMSGFKDVDQNIITGINDVQNNISEAIAKGDAQAFISAKSYFENLIPNDWSDEVTGDIVIDEDADAVTQYLQRMAKKIQDQSKNFEVKLQFKEEYESSLNTIKTKDSDTSYKDKQQEAIEIVGFYDDIINDANSRGVDVTQTMFGNIDTNNRQVLEWTKENLDKYEQAIESWGMKKEELANSFSTVLGGSGNYDGVEIAFSPMLQTESGAVLLDNNSVDKYIFGLIDKARQDGAEWSSDELFKLDAEGLEIDGQHIKGLIADVGETAIQTSEAMHFTGNTGAIADGWSQIEMAAAAAGVSAEEYVQSVKNADWKSIGIDIPETPPVLTASELLKDTDANSYIENARKMSKESYALAEAQQVMVRALSGEDGILHSDELTDMYDKWIAEGRQMPEGSNWTDDQIAGLQILDALISNFNTDIDTVKSSLIDLGLIAKSVSDIDSFKLSSESTQKQITEFKNNISSIKEAWNSLNDGEMTQSDFIDLAMQFPELMDGVNLADDNWMVKAKENLEKLNEVKIDAFIKTLNEAKAAMQSRGEDTSVVDSFINYANQIKNQTLLDAETNTVPDTISALESAYDGYKTILEETNEVLYDGQKVSADYYDSLKEYIDDVEELDSCFDKNNKSIVTNVKKLKTLITQQKNEILTTTKTARAQAQLQYQELVYDLLDATKAYELNTDAGLDEVDSLLQQIDTVQDTILQYKQLELSLLGATNAFEEFKKAQEIDSETDYETSIEEMVGAMGEGFDTGKVGTETFNAAIKGLLPEEVYGDLSDTGDLDAVWKEFTEGNLSEFFTYSKDDGFSIGLKNMENFVAKAQEMGVMIGTTFEEFDVVSGTSLKEFAKAMGLSEDATYAFLEMLSDYSIGGETLVGKLSDVQFDKGIEDATNKLNGLLEKKAEMLSSGDYDSTAMDQLNEDIETARQNLESANQAAINHANKYTTLEALQSGLTGGIQMTKSQLDDLASRLSQITGQQYTISTDGTQLLDAEGNVVDIQTMLSELGAEPTILQVQLAYDKLSSELDALLEKKRLLQTSDGYAKGLGLYNQDSVQAELNKIDGQIQAYETQMDILEVQYGIKPSEENSDTSTIEKLEDLEANGVTIPLNADAEAANQQVSEFQENAERPLETTLTVNTKTGTTSVDTDQPTGVTVDYNTGVGYQVVLNDLASLKAQTAIPITQTVTADDNGTIDAVSVEVTNLDEQNINDKSFNTSDNNTIKPITNKVTTLDNKDIEDKSFDVVMNNYDTVKDQIDTLISKLQSLDDVALTATATVIITGGNEADGTAHVNGTAFKNGSWGAPKTETALVGELGPELLVRNGRWQTIGQNGAEFTQVKRGDIIFNHKQTEQLLSNGYVTGRGHMVGGAFAEGNAYNLTYVKHQNWSGTQDYTSTFSESYSGLSNAADSIEDAASEFEEVFDWVAVRLEEVEETLNLLNATLENTAYYNEKNNIIDSIIDVNKTKLANLQAGYQEYNDYASKLLTEIPEKYRVAVQNGAIAIEEFVGEADEATLEAINNYREWAQKAADLKQQEEEVITTIRDLAIQKFDNAYEAGEVRATVEDSQTEKLQNAVDYDEERGLITSDAYYIAMMENSNKKIEYLTAAREEMQKELDAAVKSGQIEKGSNEWYELVNQMYEVDAAIDEATIEIEEFQNAINDIYWDNFDQLINRIDYLKNDTQNLIDLMDHEDMVSTPDEKRKYEGGTVEYWTADDVQWTDEGLASLGLYAQQMEIAEYEARQYATAIDDLTKEYEAGNYSENEYLEKLNELKDKQYESIESYYDAQDAIKDLNKTRIDSIKEGIEKEIEAYEELINAKKELLDSEKDMHDFQKSVMEQQKNISDIERKLAALTYDTSASAAAKRARLEAELAEARAELEETYYDRSVEDKQNALDEELENFQKEKEEEITKLEEYLENVEQVVTDSLVDVQANAAEIGKTLTDKTTEYNLTVSSAVLDPWKDGASAISSYQTAFDTAASSTTKQLTDIEALWRKIINDMAEAGKTNVGDINVENERYALGKTNWGEVAKKHLAQVEKENMGLGKYYVVKSGDNLWNIAERELGDGARWIDIFDINRSIITDPNLIQPGWKLRIPAYAKGTTSVPKDQWSIIDELGEELQLIPDGNGRLAYMKKGTGVVPADLTSNLMEWGKLDPSVMLDQNRPQIGASPSIVNNTTEIHIDASVGELLHVEHIDGNNPAEISKIVDKAWDKRMKELNSHIRRYTNR